MRKEAYHIIFESDTKAGRIFDIVLLWLILLSVGVVIVESIPTYENPDDSHFCNQCGEKITE